MRKAKGSLTVFFAFTMMMFVSLSFALTEVVHLEALTSQADILADVGAESTFSDYNRLLWKDYGIFSVDCGYCKSAPNMGYLDARMMTIVTENADPFTKGVDLLRMETKICEGDEYALLTDDHGKALIRQGALWGKTGIPAALLSSVKNRASDYNEDGGGSMDIEKAISDANEALADPGSLESTGQEQGNTVDSDDGSAVTAVSPSGEAPDNPVEEIEKLKGKTIIAQVLGDDSGLSKKKISLKERPSKRTLNKGNMQVPEDVSLTDKVLFSFYAKEKLQSYMHDLGRDGLSYEWEYLLMGNSEDRNNMADVIAALLATRSVENLLVIMQDKAKTDEVEATAQAIIGWTGLEALVKVLIAGIECAWAYLESVLDVRLLLSGGKVSMIKNSAEWTTELSLFSSYFPVEIKAKECQSGLSYEDYLMVMTAVCPAATLGENFMDLLENAMYVTEDYHESRIDNHIFAMTMNFTFEAEPVFFSLIPYSWGEYEPYTFERKRKMDAINLTFDITGG